MTETRSPEPDAEPTDEDQPAVTAHTCSSDRTVFTEEGNNDGWIATDLTVSLRR
jgi:hypothetical protein